MAEITPFRVELPDADLDDLRDRLRRTRWPGAETVDDWSQGIPLAYVQELCRYWAGEYDWRASENRLNAFPQFRVQIDGLGVHFLHVRSPHPDAFDVVCPSLPGYGFSDKPTRAGWNVDRIAGAWVQLMALLGYERYGAQGGDWGAMLTTGVAQQDPEHVAGVHVNMPVATPAGDDGELTEAQQQALADFADHQRWGTGYSSQQSTRPQTLGYGLVDSPAGQCAWIVEKFWAWTDCDGHPENALTRDELLDNVMLYWLPGTGASSARLSAGP